MEKPVTTSPDDIRSVTDLQGLASYCKAETTFTFYFSILTLSSAFLSIDNIEMKSESGFSFAMASQPFWTNIMSGALTVVTIQSSSHMYILTILYVYIVKA